MSINKAVLLVSLIILLSTVEGLKIRKHIYEPKNARSKEFAPRDEVQTKYFTQPLDHFNSQINGTWQQRYLINTQYWGSKNISSACKGPILFYTGNEGSVTEFYENSGFVTEVLAEQYGGLVIFAEHRYYGDSLPFGYRSFEKQNMGYLSVEQALADYATLIRFIKYDNQETAGSANCPVISFGGSYGGMLSAWFRLKYPHVVTGALASSAPIGWFYGAGVPELEYVYSKIVTQDYAAISPQCSANVHSGFQAIISLGSSAAGQSQLQQIFHLCNTPSSSADIDALLSFVEGALDTMGQYDYPYPSTFAGDLPGWPVQVACSYLTPANPNDQTSVLTALYQAASVYYNTSGTAGSCYDVRPDTDPYAGGWGYQSCTEMVMPYASNGVTDMFYPDAWNWTDFESACKSRWGVTPKIFWAVTEWGGLDVKATSNIIFSNGNLDPYSGGSILSSVSPVLPALYIINSAHHLDLRSPDPADPVQITQARFSEEAIITGWITDYLTLNSK